MWLSKLLAVLAVSGTAISGPTPALKRTASVDKDILQNDILGVNEAVKDASDAISSYSQGSTSGIRHVLIDIVDAYVKVEEDLFDTSTLSVSLPLSKEDAKDISNLVQDTLKVTIPAMIYGLERKEHEIKKLSEKEMIRILLQAVQRFHDHCAALLVDIAPDEEGLVAATKAIHDAFRKGMEVSSYKLDSQRTAKS